MCARLADGTAKCWGAGTSGQLGNNANTDQSTPVNAFGLLNLEQITAGKGNHTCTRSGGLVKCWGRNDFGQLGDGSNADRILPTNVPSLTNVYRVAAGRHHTCALGAGGATVLCWGRNDFGQLGDGTNIHRKSPVIVPGLTDILQLALGDTHTCALKGTGEIFCWGNKGEGQLGRNEAGYKLAPETVLAFP